MAKQKNDKKIMVGPTNLDEIFLNLPDGYWSIVVPAQEPVTNLIENPSFEFDTNNVVVTSGSAVVSAAEQYSGVASLCITPSTGGFGGILLPPGSTAFNEQHCISFCIKGPPGERFIAQLSGVPVPLTNFPAYEATTDGQWNCYTFVTYPIITSTGVAIPSFFFYGNGPFYLDAVSLIQSDKCYNYFDGWQPDAFWDGDPHESTSTVQPYNRQFGEKVNFSDMGFDIVSQQGHLMPPINNQYDEYDLHPGGFYQRDQTLPRKLTLSGLYTGCSTMDLHDAEEKMIESLIYRICTFPQPAKLCYQVIECGKCVSTILELEAVYSGGFEGYQRHCIQERFDIEFTAYDPYYKEQKQNSIELTPGINILDIDGTAPCPFDIRIYTVSGATLNSISNNTIDRGIWFGNPTPGCPLPPNEIWGIRTDPDNPSLTQYEIATQTFIDQTGKINQPLSCPSELKLIPGRNEIEIDIDLGSDAEVYILYYNCHMSASGVRRKNDTTTRTQ